MESGWLSSQKPASPLAGSPLVAVARLIPERPARAIERGVGSSGAKSKWWLPVCVCCSGSGSMNEIESFEIYRPRELLNSLCCLYVSRAQSLLLRAAAADSVRFRNLKIWFGKLLKFLTDLQREPVLLY